MKGHTILAITGAAAIALGVSAPALAQAPIATIERGSYVCELPGDASGRAGREQPAENFSILSASRYSSAQGSGTYLRRGDRLSFTSGARQGEDYAVQSGGFLRRIEDGKPGRLRCVRQAG